MEVAARRRQQVVPAWRRQPARRMSQPGDSGRPGGDPCLATAVGRPCPASAVGRPCPAAACGAVDWRVTAAALDSSLPIGLTKRAGRKSFFYSEGEGNCWRLGQYGREFLCLQNNLEGNPSIMEGILCLQNNLEGK
jgi:hypothetical protein